MTFLMSYKKEKDMAKFKVRLKDREVIEDRVKTAVRKHFLKIAEEDKFVINNLRDLNLRKEKIKKQQEALYKLDNKIDDDVNKFNESLSKIKSFGSDYSVESNRYRADGKIHIEWSNYKTWQIVRDAVMFNAEDNLSVTSLVKLESISLQDAIAEIEKLS